MERVCFYMAGAQTIQILSQSIDHDALGTINKKLEKEPQTSKNTFRRFRIAFLTRKTVSREGQKNSVYREDLLEAVLGFYNQ